jgi:hypothetical protein
MTTNSPQTSSPHSKGLVMALIVTVILAGVMVTVLAMVLLARDALPAAVASPIPTASGDQPTLAPSPSVTPEASPEPTPAHLAPDTIARVTVNELNLREGSSSSATSLGHLSAGARVFVVEGPEQADGYDWYRVATVEDPVTAPSCTADACPTSTFGWAAGIGEAGDAWLAPAELTCPPAPKLKAFARLDPFERLACYGDRELTLKGVVWQPCCGYVGAFVYEPSWLSWPSGPPVLTSGELHRGGLMLRFDPRDDLQRPDYADIVRVTGHMDDPAAATCTVRVEESALHDDPTVAVDPDELAYAPIGCRTEFVVDSIEILGNTGEKCLC